ncbi:MAG TPA: hypothetical protein VF355_06915, partial [Anaerolineaceae bacterium]
MSRKTMFRFLSLLVLMALLLAACAPAVEPAPTTAPTMLPTLAPTQAPTTVPAPANPELILATTTSTRDTGLLDVLLPMFTQQ